MDRRKHPRFPLSVPIRIHIDDIDRFALQHSLDLSEGGMFVHTGRPFREGMKIKLEFYFRREGRSIPAEGVVVRSIVDGHSDDEQAGVAINFTELDDAALKFITLAIDKWNLHHPSQVLQLPDGFFEELDTGTHPPAPRPTSPHDDS